MAHALATQTYSTTMTLMAYANAMPIGLLTTGMLLRQMHPASHALTALSQATPISQHAHAIATLHSLLLITPMQHFRPSAHATIAQETIPGTIGIVNASFVIPLSIRHI